MEGGIPGGGFEFAAQPSPRRKVGTRARKQPLGWQWRCSPAARTVRRRQDTSRRGTRAGNDPARLFDAVHFGDRVDNRVDHGPSIAAEKRRSGLVPQRSTDQELEKLT